MIKTIYVLESGQRSRLLSLEEWGVRPSISLYTSKEIAVTKAKEIVRRAKDPMRESEHTNYWENDDFYISVHGKIICD